MLLIEKVPRPSACLRTSHLQCSVDTVATCAPLPREGLRKEGMIQERPTERIR